MGRVSHADVMGLPDAAQTWNWTMFIPSIPNGGGSAAQQLTIKCKTTEIPSSKLSQLKIELAGVSKQEAGRAEYDHTFSTTFLETVDYQTYLAFRAWRDYMRSWKNNTGSDSRAYKRNLELDMFDNAPEVGMTVKLMGAWPAELQAIPLDGAGQEAVMISVQWSFDYIDDGQTF